MIAYRPIAKLKTNDVQAFNLLETTLRRNISPFFEMVKMPDDGDEAKHIQKTLAALSLYKDGSTPAVDLSRFPPGTLIDGRHPAEIGFEWAYAKGMHVIPVVPLYTDTHSREILAGAAQKHRRGICIRIDGEDIVLSAERTIRQLSALRREDAFISIENDLLVDFGKLGRFGRDAIIVAALRFLNLLDGYGHSYRSITLAGSTVVNYVNEAASEENTTGSVRREELDIWTRVARNYGWNRRLCFSDYGIIRPEHMDNIKNKYTNGKIRYTAGASTHYVRGCRKTTKSLANQYPSLAKRVVTSDFYKGASYCFADDFFWKAAHGHANTGSMGKWVQLDMNHHLTYVYEQMKALLALTDRERASEALTDTFIELF